MIQERLWVFSLFSSASSFCNFISVADCPCFCFLLLLLNAFTSFLSDFWLFLFFHCFIFFHFNSMYMVFITSLFFPLDLLISLSSASSFVIASPSVPVPLFAADLSASFSHLFSFLPSSVMLALALFASPSPCSVFLSFQNYLFFHASNLCVFTAAWNATWSVTRCWPVGDGTVVLHNLMQLSLAYEPHLCISQVSLITFDPQDEARSNLCSNSCQTVLGIITFVSGSTLSAKYVTYLEFKKASGLFKWCLSFLSSSGENFNAHSFATHRHKTLFFQQSQVFLSELLFACVMVFVERIQ